MDNLQNYQSIDLHKANILVTGGCGFIGCNFIRYIFKHKSNFKGRIINVDKLTYAGSIENIIDIEKEYGSNYNSYKNSITSKATNNSSSNITCYSENSHRPRYKFYKEDICNFEKMIDIIENESIDIIVHFAAESHVDRSIYGPADFIETNIVGTFKLLEAVRKVLETSKNKLIRFHHISTDEVFGSIQKGYFTENTPYDPHSPYSASKASSDHLVKAYFHTYGIPVTISNCSNNYGPFQFPEKLIPLSIMNMIEGKAIPIYGDGKYVRDWLYVEDHCEAIWQILEKGKIGETYNIGGNNEIENIELIKKLCKIMAKYTRKSISELENLIVFVKDRPGHDRRYAIDTSKIKTNLGWQPKITNLEDGLEITVKWYLNNLDWIQKIKSRIFKNWIEKNYGNRI